MSVATIDPLEEVYGLLKQHEISLAQVARSGFRVESDTFCDLLFDTRSMALEIEEVLARDKTLPNQINIPAMPSIVTPSILIAQRKAFRSAYDRAVSDQPADSEARKILEDQMARLNGTGQEKLEILSAAIVGEQ